MAGTPQTPPANGLPAAYLAAALDELDTGVVLCDARAQALSFNEAARRELTDGGVLRLVHGGGLDADGDSGLLELRRAVHNAAVRGLRQLVPLHAGARRLMVAVQPLRTEAEAPPIAVLLLGRRQLCPELLVEMLGRLHDLTLAERRVLKGLISGQPVSALARARGVAVSTVRSQVAALRAKFGVQRIDDLVMLVAEMPPMVNVLRTLSPGLRAPSTREPLPC